jgi:alpha-L-rhamnosidase
VKKTYLLILLGLSLSTLVFAQDKISAPWISYPSANVTEYGVYHFRKTFDLDKVPDNLIIHVSADNRYNLFVNGERICYGPAKGDLKTYKYDVIDIAKYLNPGKNVLAALVYNGGKDKPLSFISVQTAFMFRAESQSFSWLNSNSSWKVFKNPAYKVISYNEMLFKERWFNGFYACGGGDDVDGNLYPWGWEQPGFDDSKWQGSESLDYNGDAPWRLVPRNIAFMDNHREQPARIRKADGLEIPVGTWNGKSKLTIPANTKASILIDFDIFTMGYPEITVDRGSNSSVKIKYAEALYEDVNLKAHRDSVAGKTMYGVWDVFHPDGKAARTFRPLWKRAFRYVQLVIETNDQPLDILTFGNEYSGYPYKEMATFESNDKKLNEVFNICLRTLRLCSGETYYDTPYYEQLSYGGDNRPISAISTYNSTDDRLLREVMRLYPQSENRETGLFKSAYPSRFDFDMGSWSLAWIQSLHDYYNMRGDSAYITQFTNNIEGVLGFYERHLDEKTGLVGTVKNNNFIDWSITKGSMPRANEKKEMKQSALLTLYYAHTLDCAARLFNQLGLQGKAKHWENISKGIKVAVYVNCWDNQKQLFRDYPDQQIFSQQTNILAILCDILSPFEQTGLLDRILKYDKFDEMASSYFSFFLFKAMQKTDQEDLFLSHLNFWYAFIDRGLTTCGETGFKSHDRSDCHAWSAHPAYFLLSSVCGIKPADIGFNKVVIDPHIGTLTSLKASMPHPRGMITVDYKVVKERLAITIDLPQGMDGTFRYGHKNMQLKNGYNKFLVTK